MTTPSLSNWFDHWTEWFSTGQDTTVKPRHKLLKGGSYNCRVGRQPEQVATFVRHLLRATDRDFLTLSESSQYLDALNQIPGWQLISFPGKRDGEVAIMVRDGINVSQAAIVRNFNEGWPRDHGGGMHEPRVLVSALLDGWLRVAAIHAPPRGKDRIRARHEYMRVLTDWTIAHPGALVPTGDWNFRMTDELIRKYIRDTNMRMYPSGGIDFAMARNCRIRFMHHYAQSGGSDHHPILYRVIA